MKLHLCSGSIYLEDYVNCDVNGKLAYNHFYKKEYEWTNHHPINPNLTTLDKYFKDPWEPDPTKRKRKEFIIDMKLDILDFWPWQCNTVDEIIMVSAFEHFEHATEIPHIINEAHRVLKVGCIFKFDFPDIKAQVDQYYGKNDEFLMELIYCNHKNKHSMHLWGYTKNTIGNYLSKDKWDIEFKDVVKHDYPMQGVWATRK